MRSFSSKVKRRAWLLELGLLVSIGSSLFVLLIVVTWRFDTAAALILLGVWVYGSRGWFLLLALMLADVLVYAVKGRTFLVHAINAMAMQREQIEARYRSLGKSRRWRRSVYTLAFYTNPFSPLLVMLATFLIRQPKWEEGVAGVIEAEPQKLAAKEIRNRSVDWHDHISGPRAAFA